jgi:hypothetical protein
MLRSRPVESCSHRMSWSSLSRAILIVRFLYPQSRSDVTRRTTPVVENLTSSLFRMCNKYTYLRHRRSSGRARDLARYQNCKAEFGPRSSCFAMFAETISFCLGLLDVCSWPNVSSQLTLGLEGGAGFRQPTGHGHARISQVAIASG